MSDTPNADLERWVHEVVAGKTTLGFHEWSAQPPLCTQAEALVLAAMFREVDRTRSALREALRPYAVRVMGDWARLDDEAHKRGRVWRHGTPIFTEDGLVSSLRFFEVVEGHGHNEVTTSKSHLLDLFP